MNEILRKNSLTERAEKDLQKIIDDYMGIYGSEDVYSKEISPILDSYMEYCAVLYYSK